MHIFITSIFVPLFYEPFHIYKFVQIEKNKPKKKSAPNNPRVKHREKFRKAKIRRKGKVRTACFLNIFVYLSIQLLLLNLCYPNYI